jgi:hypothetical protein
MNKSFSLWFVSIIETQSSTLYLFRTGAANVPPLQHPRVPDKEERRLTLSRQCLKMESAPGPRACTARPVAANELVEKESELQVGQAEEKRKNKRSSPASRQTLLMQSFFFRLSKSPALPKMLDCQ